MMFGERLDEALAICGMKQKDLAKAMGMTEATISRYICGKRTPDIATAAKMADMLGISLDRLCGTA